MSSRPSSPSLSPVPTLPPAVIHFYVPGTVPLELGEGETARVFIQLPKYGRLSNQWSLILPDKKTYASDTALLLEPSILTLGTNEEALAADFKALWDTTSAKERDASETRRTYRIESSKTSWLHTLFHRTLQKIIDSNPDFAKQTTFLLEAPPRSIICFTCVDDPGKWASTLSFTPMVRVVPKNDFELTARPWPSTLVTVEDDEHRTKPNHEAATRFALSLRAKLEEVNAQWFDILSHAGRGRQAPLLSQLTWEAVGKALEESSAGITVCFVGHARTFRDLRRIEEKTYRACS